MFKRIISRIAAVMLAGGLVLTGIPYAGGRGGNVTVQAKESVPVLLAQLRKDNRDKDLDSGEAFLPIWSVSIKKGKSYDISKADPKFTKKNLKKKKASVKVTALPVFSGKNAKQYVKVRKNKITAIAPIKTAVKVVYTYHKPKTVKKTVKKKGKKVTVKKTTFSKKAYKQVRLLCVVSCPDSDPVYEPDMKPVDKAGSGYSDAIYSHKNYVLLMLHDEIYFRDDYENDDDDDDDEEDTDTDGQSSSGTKDDSDGVTPSDDTDSKKSDEDGKESDGNTPDDTDDEKKAAEGHKFDDDDFLVYIFRSYKESFGFDEDDIDMMNEKNNAYRKAYRLWKEAGYPSDEESLSGIWKVIEKDIKDRRAAEEEKKNNPPKKTFDDHDFDIYYNNTLYDRLGSYADQTEDDYKKAVRLWNEAGCPSDEESLSGIIDVIEKDVKDRKAAAEESEKQKEKDAYKTYRSSFMESLGISSDNKTVIQMIDTLAEQRGYSNIVNISYDDLHAALNDTYLPDIRKELKDYLDKEITDTQNLNKNDTYTVSYINALTTYRDGSTPQITEFYTSAYDRFQDLKTEAASSAAIAVETEKNKKEEQTVKDPEGYRQNKDGTISVTPIFDPDSDSAYYGVHKEVLEAYKITAGEGSDFRRYSRIFHRTQKEVCYGNAYGNQYSVKHNPNNYIKYEDGSFHFTLVCDGWAELVAGICQYCGIPAEAGGEDGHAWVHVTLGGEEYNSDPTLYHINQYFALYRNSPQEDKSDMPNGAWLVYFGEENCLGDFEKYGY